MLTALSVLIFVVAVLVVWVLCLNELLSSSRVEAEALRRDVSRWIGHHRSLTEDYWDIASRSAELAKKQGEVEA